jgi:hypothetical protein
MGRSSWWNMARMDLLLRKELSDSMSTHMESGLVIWIKELLLLTTMVSE